MVKLTAAKRTKLPEWAFALPERRAYPIFDEEHAVAALGEVSAHGSPADRLRVCQRVHALYPYLHSTFCKIHRNCVNCLRPAKHLHGFHGCCTRPTCHRRIVEAHQLLYTGYPAPASLYRKVMEPTLQGVSRLHRDPTELSLNS